MERIKGYFTKEFAANTVEPLSHVAKLIVRESERRGHAPIGELTGELIHLERDFIEGKPPVCIWTFTPGIR
jgi:hypothetical protein